MLYCGQIKYLPKAYCVVSHENFAYASLNTSLGCQEFIIEVVKSLISSYEFKQEYMDAQEWSSRYIHKKYLRLFSFKENNRGGVLNW